MRTVPADGVSRPPMMRSRVDLPQPLVPTTPMISPRPTESSTLSSAVTIPAPPGASKRLERPLISSIFLPFGRCNEGILPGDEAPGDADEGEVARFAEQREQDDAADDD